MDKVLLVLLIAVLVGGLTFLLTYLYLDKRAHSHVRRAQDEANRIREEAESQRRDVAITEKDEAIRLRADLDRELTQRRKEIDRIERRIEQKEEAIDRKVASFDQREAQVRKQEQQADRTREQWEQERNRQQADLDASREKRREELERVAGLSADDAKQELVREVEAEARSLATRRVHEIEQEIREEADRRSRKILATAVQRIATDYIAESTVSSVPLPSDDMKGRIIGREGRNIRAIEQATGVDLIVDDTPEMITVSCFDPVRREIARRSLTKLLQDGRIHPARIEEVVAKTTQELDQVMHEEGEKVAYEANVVGSPSRTDPAPGAAEVPHELRPECPAALAGSLDHRGRASAAELGADINVAKTAGTAARHRQGSGSRGRGAARADRRGNRQAARPVATDRPRDRGASRRGGSRQTVEAFIVATADAISGGRPGARREMVDATSSGWKRWKAWRTRSMASRSPSPSRRAAKSASWSAGQHRRSRRRRAWRAMSSRRSKRRWSIRARSRSR